MHGLAMKEINLGPTKLLLDDIKNEVHIEFQFVTRELIISYDQFECFKNTYIINGPFDTIKWKEINKK